MRTVGVLFAAALMTAGVFVTSEADARVRRGHATVQTDRGEYDVNSRVERRRGFRGRDAVITGPNGRQSSVHDQRTWNRREGVRTHDRERVFANGDTRTVSSDAQRTEPGVWAYERDVTGRNGETRSQTGTVTIDRTP